MSFIEVFQKKAEDQEILFFSSFLLLSSLHVFAYKIQSRYLEEHKTLRD